MNALLVCPSCGEGFEAPADGSEVCPVCGTTATESADAGRERLRQEVVALRTSRRRQGRIAAALILLGLPLSIAGTFLAVMSGDDRPEAAMGGLFAMWTGIALYVVGLAFFSKYKGRHPLWAGFGLFLCVGPPGFVGLLLIALLRDENKKRLEGLIVDLKADADMW